MTINTDIMWFYIAIGGVTKLVTLRYPTPGQQWAAGMEVVGGGVAAGWLAGVFIPPGLDTVAMGFCSLPFIFSMAGGGISRLVDEARIWIWERKQRARETEGDRPESERVERGD